MDHGRLTPEVGPSFPCARTPQGTELDFELGEAFLLVERPELRMGVLGAVVRATLVEAYLSGETPGIEQPYCVYFACHE